MELEEILKKDYVLDANLAHFLAYFSEGRIGSALKLKDTDILKNKNRIIDEFAFTDRPFKEGLLMQNRDGIRGYLNMLASWFRDIYLIKTGLAHRELVNLDRKDQLLKLMNSYTWLDLDDSLSSISNSLLLLEQNINLKLLLSNLKMELRKEWS